MKTSYKILATMLVLIALSCQSKKEISEKKEVQAFFDQVPVGHHQVALEVLKASKEWIQSFNKGDWESCVNGYEDMAIMRAIPIGVKNGKDEISNFWKNFIESGASDLEYSRVRIEVVNDSTALLSANWKMNVGNGVIFQEKWEKKSNRWLLTYDDFEVKEQYKEPKKALDISTKSHDEIEAVINASVFWIKSFNKQESMGENFSYTESALMNAIPFTSRFGKENIGDFWKQLIKDGANHLIYNRPVFTSVDDNKVKIAATWSMNIGEGEIYQEKWVKKNEEWLLEYDEFEVLKKY